MPIKEKRLFYKVSDLPASPADVHSLPMEKDRMNKRNHFILCKSKRRARRGTSGDIGHSSLNTYLLAIEIRVIRSEFLRPTQKKSCCLLPTMWVENYQ